MTVHVADIRRIVYILRGGKVRSFCPKSGSMKGQECKHTPWEFLMDFVDIVAITTFYTDQDYQVYQQTLKTLEVTEEELDQWESAYWDRKHPQAMGG